MEEKGKRKNGSHKVIGNNTGHDEKRMDFL